MRFELEMFLPYALILELAHYSGFFQRIRKIHPVVFLQVILFTPRLHRHATVAEIWRKYQDLTASNIAYSSFVERINDGAVKFFKPVLDECFKSPVDDIAL